MIQKDLLDHTTFNMCFRVVLGILFCIQGVMSQDQDMGSFFSNEMKLYHNLSNNYASFIRPVNHHNGTITVAVGLSPTRINELNAEKQILSMDAWLIMQWDDPRLKWDPNDFDGVRELRLPVQRVWTPDIVLYDQPFNTGGNQDNPLLNVLVNYTGKVFVVPYYQFEAACNIDLSDFPYDTQTCFMRFGSWSYNKNQLDVVYFHPFRDVDLSLYKENNEWELVKTSAKVEDLKYDCCPEIYPLITFSFVLRRQRSFVSHNLVTPSTLLLFLTPCLFWLPTMGTEKFALGTIITIGQTLLYVMLQYMIPASYPVVPFIGVLYLAGLGLAIVSLMLCVMVRYIWTQSERKRKFPSIFKVVVLRCGNLCCIPGDSSIAPHKEDKENSGNDQAQTEDDNEDHTSPSYWCQLAILLDRFFFLCTLVIVIIITAVTIAG